MSDDLFGRDFFTSHHFSHSNFRVKAGLIPNGSGLSYQPHIIHPSVERIFLITSSLNHRWVNLRSVTLFGNNKTMLMDNENNFF